MVNIRQYAAYDCRPILSDGQTPGSSVTKDFKIASLKTGEEVLLEQRLDDGKLNIFVGGFVVSKERGRKVDIYDLQPIPADNKHDVEEFIKANFPTFKGDYHYLS